VKLGLYLCSMEYELAYGIIKLIVLKIELLWNLVLKYFSLIAFVI